VPFQGLANGCPVGTHYGAPRHDDNIQTAQGTAVVPEAFSCKALYSIAIDSPANALLRYGQAQTGPHEFIRARKNGPEAVLRALRP